MERVLIVDDDKHLRFALRRILAPAGYEVDEAATGDEALARTAAGPYAAIFLDLRMPGLTGMQVLERLQKADNKVPVIIMTAYGTTETAIEAVKQGAYDFILKPFEVSEILSLTQQAVTAHRMMTSPVGMSTGDDSAVSPERDTLVGLSKAMQEVYKQIGRVAPSDASVVIIGPSGTGKELVARAIYQHSRRADKPFLAVNCAAIPEGLLESELFGHERGSFTSADHRRLGKFERANGGTLFLDEIGDMTPATQAKVLRVLQDGVIERVGGTESIRVNARIITASNRDVAQMVRDGRFREDLYFRLNVFSIVLPSLAERREDVPVLVRYFVERERRRLGRAAVGIPDETMEQLVAHTWRGNVRELENVIARAMIVSTGPALLPESIQFTEVTDSGIAPTALHLDRDLFDAVFTRLAQHFSGHPDQPILTVLEREMLMRAMVHAHGNQVQAARLLGISRQTLRNRLADEETGPSVLSDEGM